jgi:DNA invertase Pin-like site-specific DNA recombinase
MVRQILGAVSQFEKAMLVAKLKGARERKHAATGKCEGRKTYAERSPHGDARRAATSLHHRQAPAVTARHRSGA